MKIVMFPDDVFQENLNLIDTAVKIVGGPCVKSAALVIDAMEKHQHVPDVEPKPLPAKRTKKPIPAKKVKAKRK